ncbi:MAG: guanylate kinase [Firmicutes bacterium]|jgi:guanylate kinase|nr:guanylate kinase [Bacillota bacterium]MBQ1629915.1 guanylate kinase [Bacillota bacterium]MBQ1690307.1 guanylate kinase [Bacillota bacterium]MBQ2305397.1 guanylate kinase [Bacillota bacterium]
MKNKKDEGKLFIISGPSGAGKGTICNRIIEETELEFSVSMTTRAPREGEVDGVHYYFVDEETFVMAVAEGGLLENAEVFGNRYGTPKGPVLEKLSAGTDILLDIDVQGALQIKENYPDGVFIFLVPPSMGELRRRLENRGTETREKIELRLSKARTEMAYVDSYDYLVVNDDLDEAVNRVKAIILAEHSRVNVTGEELVKEYSTETEEE